MRLTLRQLRCLIREHGLETDMRNMAGTCGGEGANASVRDREAILNPPPNLGSPEELEDDDEDFQKKNQTGVRVYDREGGTNVDPRKPIGK
jgi:hypothetical protein